MIKRLFLAINLPAEIKEEIFNVVLKLRKANKNKFIKWVAKENLHLTLHFLGSVSEEKIEEINQSLESVIINFQALNFQLSKTINAFPDLNNPRVIFLEIKELDNNKIIQLHKKIGETLEILGFEIDKRPFRLHLTLGRIKFKTSLKIPRFEIKSLQFKAQSVDLMESKLIPQGPIYKVVSQYGLLTYVV